MAETNTSGTRILMFPWFALGHITPYLHLANKLAKKGYRITFATPGKAINQLQLLNEFPDLISFHPITVPSVTGLPPGTETASDIPIFLSHFLAIAMDLTIGQLESLIKSINPKLIIFDAAHWIPDVARPLGIKTMCFNVVCAASLAIVLVPARNIPTNRPITIEELASTPPGYPSSTVVLRGKEVQTLLFVTNPFGEGLTFHGRTTMAMKNCDVLAQRTCNEIEGKLCDYIGSQYQKRVLLTGPLLPEESNSTLDEQRGNWLAGFKPGSVVFCALVFCALGSQIILTGF